MRHPSRLQISNLEPIQSGVEQELTLEEAEKIIGGSANKDKAFIVIPIKPITPAQPA